MVPIVQKDNEILRKVAKEVAISDIGSPKIKKILSDMKIALDSQEDGVAIAAPQIGVSLRIFVVSEKALDIPDKKEDRKKRVKDPKKVYGHITYINPVITKISKDKSLMEEGCLSVRYAYGKVDRSEKATVKAYDENGKLFTKGASGLMAQIFQHETDHLNGVLFVDKAIDVKEIPPEKESQKS
jgi:peptide deformylase